MMLIPIMATAAPMLIKMFQNNSNFILKWLFNAVMNWLNPVKPEKD